MKRLTLCLLFNFNYLEHIGQGLLKIFICRGPLNPQKLLVLIFFLMARMASHHCLIYAVSCTASLNVKALCSIAVKKSRTFLSTSERPVANSTKSYQQIQNQKKSFSLAMHKKNNFGELQTVAVNLFYFGPNGQELTALSGSMICFKLNGKNVQKSGIIFVTFIQQVITGLN
jgi:hypothetical protein